MPNMRKHWFEYVAKTRKRMQRKAGKKTVITHKQAMTEASKGWCKEKVKIQRKELREKKKNPKVEKVAEETNEELP